MPRCRTCKEKFDQYEFNNKYCKEIDCQTAKALFKLDKIKKADDKKRKSEKKNKINLHPDIYHPELKKELQKAINHIARLIDKDCRCIDCDRTEAKPCWDGGHYTSRGSQPKLRYNLHNIFKQTRYCNSKSEGNKIEYLNGIEKMYGKEYSIRVINLPKELEVLKLPNGELPEKLKIARQILRELKKLDMNYPPKTRIELRENYNNRLGIYG